MNENKHIDVRLDYRLNAHGKGEFLLYCDSSKINQVLYNLLDNAVKFTDRGSINVHASMHDSNDIVVKVEDSGAGIDPEVRNKLFVKFATKSDGGTGLGLYLTKKIIEAHGGRTWAANNLAGTGATFSFTLPTDLRPAAANERISAEGLESRSDVDEYTQEGTVGLGVKEK